MKPRQFFCSSCGGLFNQVGMGRPRRYCDGCKGTPLPKVEVKVGNEVIPGRVEWTNPPCTQELFDLALGIVRDVAAGRNCHLEAVALLRRIGG